MENLSMEEQLISPEEKEQLEFMWNIIPAEDRVGMQRKDILFVLDAMDDYLEEQGLLEYDDKTGEVTYLDGDVDETEQLNYVMNAVQKEGLSLTHVQVQLIIDAEYQYGVEQGYYEDED